MVCVFFCSRFKFGSIWLFIVIAICSAGQINVNWPHFHILIAIHRSKHLFAFLPPLQNVFDIVWHSSSAMSFEVEASNIREYQSTLQRY